MKLNSKTMDILDVMALRTSCRTYASQPIPPDLRSQIIDLLKSPVKSPFDGSCRLEFITLDGIPPNEKRKLGTYGFISGARDFIAGIVPQDGKMNVEHMGYVLEDIILKLTRMNLGTCWLGGTFNRSGFSETLELGPDESIPGVTPVGIPATKRRLLDKVFRTVIKANSRKPWESMFFIDSFDTPLHETDAGDKHDPLEALRIAPSAKNIQPWRVLMVDQGTTFHFYMKGGYKLDRGIAACHFDLVAKERGITGTWKHNRPSIDEPSGLDYLITFTT